jgi:hypothetical protein
MSVRITRDDLLLAADWCESGYEEGPDDPNGARLDLVAEWLRREVARRDERATRAAVGRRVKLPPNHPRVVAAVRKRKETP